MMIKWVERNKRAMGGIPKKHGKMNEGLHE